MIKWLGKLRNRKVQIAIIIIISVVLGSVFIYNNQTEVLPDASIQFLSDVKLPESGQRILVFSPHPDDETLGAGGYVAMSVKRGANVEIVLVTDGNKHNLKEKRYAEFKKATGILGVPDSNLVYLNYSDGKLDKVDQNELKTKFEEEIKADNPSFVIYPNPKDQHPDHATVGRLVKEDLSSDSKEITSYQYLVHHPNFPQPKKLDSTGYLLPPTRMISFDEEWQKLMLPRDIEDKKSEAINTYQTQLKNPFLHNLLLSFIRQNELFSFDGVQ